MAALSSFRSMKVLPKLGNMNPTRLRRRSSRLLDVQM
jgi:hypothetical protein